MVFGELAHALAVGVQKYHRAGSEDEDQTQPQGQAEVDAACTDRHGGTGQQRGAEAYPQRSGDGGGVRVEGVHAA